MPLLNRENLEEEFNMEEPIEAEVVDEPVEAEVVDEDIFESEWEAQENPRTKLENNIERANELLDTCQDELSRGNFTPRLVEVAAGLINSVTASAKELISDENYNKYLHLRKRMVYLKKVEIEFKTSGRSGGITNNNLIISNREDLLKLLDKKQETPENT